MYLAGSFVLVVWGFVSESEVSCVLERRFSFCYGLGIDCVRNWWRVRWGSSSRVGRRV